MDADEIKEIIRTLIDNESNDETIYETLVKYKEHGLSQDAMYAIFDSLREEMRNKGEEAKEDKIMEFMDLVTGFCNHKWKIYD